FGTKAKEDEDEDPMKAALKKAVAGLFAASSTPDGEGNMTFKLRNDKNEEVEVSLSQLEAAGIKVVKDGETAIPTGELASMKTTITNLSTTVDALKADADETAKKARLFELNAELDRLLKGAFITKVTRDALFAQFKDSTDLSGFKAIAGTFKEPILALNREHGSAADGEAVTAEVAQKEIISLANTMVKEQGISLSEAVKRAGAQLTERAEQYRESYATVG